MKPKLYGSVSPPNVTPPTFYHQTFMHELIHAVLDTMGREELSKDEGFVDALSEYITQAILTSEGGFGKSK